MIENDIYKVGIYLRLSREDERLGESGSITTQRDMLLNYIKDNDLFFVKEYVDDGISGTTFNREGFNQMIKDVNDKKINMIITKDTSRLGRDHIEFGYYVERFFPEHGVRYVAITDGIDTGISSSSNDMLVFKSAFNDMYVKDISNKMRTSLYTKKRNGKFVGCYAPYGYKKDLNDKHKLVIDNNVSYIVKRIFKMFMDGYSLTKICDILTNEKISTPSIYKNMKCGQNNLHYGVWSTRTISDILKNPTYIGNLCQCRNKKVNYKSKKIIHTKPKDWIISENSCPAIIDKDTFEIVNNMFLTNRNRQNHSNSGTNNILLRGLIYCMECKHTIGWRVHKQNTKKYGTIKRIYGNCNYWSKRKKLNVCTPHSIKYEYIEDIVLGELKTIFKTNLNIGNLELLLKDNDQLLNKKIDIKKEIIRMKKKIEVETNKIDIIYNDKLEGNIDINMYKRTYNNILLNIEEYNTKIISLEKEILLLNNISREDNFYFKKINKFISLKNPTRDLIANLIEKIEIDKNKNINIYYKFKLF